MRAWVFLALALAGCAKCGGARATDAGVDAGVAQVKRSIDLRTALVQAYPEYRGTALISASASTTRVYRALPPAQRDEAFSKLGFTGLVDGGAGWFRAPFTVTEPTPGTLHLSIPLSAEDIGNLYLAPAGLSSEELALYLPRLPAGREEFEVKLHYSSAPERSLFIVRQAVHLLTAAGLWKVTQAPERWAEQPDDGGPVDLPEVFDVTVETPGTRIHWHRERGQVWVHYRLETVR